MSQEFAGPVSVCGPAVWRAILDGLAEAVVVTDEAGRVRLINPAATRLFDRQPEEVLGRDVSLLLVEPEGVRTGGVFPAGSVSGWPGMPGGGGEAEGIRGDGSRLFVRLGLTEIECGGQKWLAGVVTERRMTEERYRLLLEAIEAPIVALDHNLRVVYGNPALSAATGRPATGLEGEHLEDVLPGIRQTPFFPVFEQVLASGGGQLTDGVYDGRTWLLRVYPAPFGVLGVAQDVTERRTAEQALAHSEATLRAILETAADGIVVVGRSGRIEALNPAAERMFGYAIGELLGQDVSRLMPPDVADRHRRGRGRGGRVSLPVGSGRELTARRRDASLFPIDLSVSEFQVGGESRFTVLIRDISRRKALENQLRHEATHDELTGLHNRRYFNEMLAQGIGAARRHGHPLGLCLCDIDHFKQINDVHGHAFGDEVIQVFARVLTVGRRSGDVVARFGGDEFCILLPYVAQAEVGGVAERIRRAVSGLSLKCPNGGRLHLTGSFGVVGLAPGRDRPETLMRAADIALYRAKAAGRNRVAGPGDQGPVPAGGG